MGGGKPDAPGERDERGERDAPPAALTSATSLASAASLSASARSRPTRGGGAELPGSVSALASRWTSPPLVGAVRGSVHPQGPLAALEDALPAAGPRGQRPPPPPAQPLGVGENGCHPQLVLAGAPGAGGGDHALGGGERERAP